MTAFISFFGSGFFFVPFVYVALYLCAERVFAGRAFVQRLLKTFTLIGGIALVLSAFVVSPESMVLLPSRGSAKHHVAASAFLVIVGVAIVALPFFSKHLQFSHRNP
jgi:hypothetical protein